MLHLSTGWKQTIATWQFSSQTRAEKRFILSLTDPPKQRSGSMATAANWKPRGHLDRVETSGEYSTPLGCAVSGKKQIRDQIPLGGERAVRPWGRRLRSNDPPRLAARPLSWATAVAAPATPPESGFTRELHCDQAPVLLQSVSVVLFLLPTLPSKNPGNHYSHQV